METKKSPKAAANHSANPSRKPNFGQSGLQSLGALLSQQTFPPPAVDIEVIRQGLGPLAVPPKE